LDVKKRFSEEQIIGLLREAETGLPVAELCRRHGFSDASFYLWSSKFGGMNVSDAKKLKELEVENARGIQLFLIKPGKPNQNAYIESFNGRFRNECLNEHWFTSLQQARMIMETWRRKYN
jgi:putative transposase